MISEGIIMSSTAESVEGTPALRAEHADAQRLVIPPGLHQELENNPLAAGHCSAFPPSSTRLILQ